MPAAVLLVVQCRVRLIAAGAVLAVALLCLPGASVAAGATGPYVSLGGLVHGGADRSSAHGNPIGCGRSTNNYPSDVARTIAPASFNDVSCSSATTTDMTQPQAVPFGGTNPPQFNAVTSGDTLVTLGIRGNNAGLIGVVETCAEIDLLHPFGSACKNHYQSSGDDPNVAAINATGPKVTAVLRGIHTRAPYARVLIVGYPDGLPVNGSNCWPLVPLSSGDIKYLNALEAQLNSVIKKAAGANAGTYVDTFNSSIGHDACRAPGVAWVNGIVPTSLAYPLHPNEAGERNMANQVLRALG